jgi:LacI family transcriptional regulator
MKNIAVVVETALASGRDILCGISRFLHERDDWTIFHQTGPLGSMEPSSLNGWSGDGIIARVTGPEVLALVKSKNVPVVDVLGNIGSTGFPSVICDDAAISNLAAEHFINLQFHHFAFLGIKDKLWSSRRSIAFEQAVSKHPGASFSLLEISYDEKINVTWQAYLKRLQEWIAPLPKPLALMVCCDQMGADVLQVCRSLDLAVPGEVSVVGVDNDISFCGVCVPTLSSVMANHEEVGYRAAVILDQMITGASKTSETFEVNPVGLQIRNSSDATASDDRNLIKAYQLIREKACKGLQVDEVAAYAGMSRSVLQRKFQKAYGHTVLDAIVMIRVERAKAMLENTDLTVDRIAKLSGFKNRAYLGYVLKKRTGQTATDFRLEH